MATGLKMGLKIVLKVALIRVRGGLMLA